MNRQRRLICLLLCLALFLAPALPVRAAGEQGTFPLTVRINGRDTVVRACDGSYEGNTFLSLTDLSAALRGTKAQFRFVYSNTANDGETFSVLTGEAGAARPGTPGDVREPITLSLQRNRIFVDGGERRYYTHRNGGNDLYMSLTDIQLMLDIRAEMPDEDTICFYPGEPFVPDIDALFSAGYFDAFNGIVLGDVETGHVFFSHAGEQAYPIASTSKLMTYLLLKEAERVGEIRWDDMVAISAEAARLSRGSDGMVPLTEGASVPLSELVDAMLLASSNESAHALAEHLCGSVELFTEKMNQRARSLDLESARFYNPHGLPFYSGGLLSGKLQNRMSAFDLYALSRYILLRFPEICDTTSLQYGQLPTLNYITANSNPLVFNMANVTGLKTGSTNRAGYCVVASARIEAADGEHTVLLVFLGAEGPEARGQAAEILLRSAAAFYEKGWD